ncbi:putative serine/threonine-protein kinase dyrk1 [Porphyridium purpureum]|uniref:Putative serine/threonine-protein kinase dyrk1 n=1 Tax=Porphyridium purpureum TaxID=35688 RepID=A0A5J4ZBQ7_PORPP|nr:putative serine/threonine-protein kinase dyrk1 [Porphyridium purpureum]|eukprot:POR6899..scf295_1
MSELERKGTAPKKKKGFSSFWGSVKLVPTLDKKDSSGSQAAAGVGALTLDAGDDDSVGNLPAPLKLFADTRRTQSSTQYAEHSPSSTDNFHQQGFHGGDATGISDRTASGSLASTVAETHGLRRSFVDIRRGKRLNEVTSLVDRAASNSGVGSSLGSRENSLSSAFMEDFQLYVERLHDMRKSTSLIMAADMPHSSGKKARHERSGPEAYNQKMYDDASTDYYVLPGEVFRGRYVMESVLGRGTFGQVVRAYDMLTRKRVALKIIKSEKAFFDTSQEEVRMARLLQECDPDDKHHIMRVYDTFIYRGHQCLVFELLNASLYDHLALKGFRGCSLEFVRTVAQQLLECLQFLALPENDIIHCDLKPENILLVVKLQDASKPQIKLVDFGSAHQVSSSSSMDPYIQSRFYRAPEVLLSFPSYSTQIDMWSLGCILAELYTGAALFPGKDHKDQMCLIVEMLGMPPANMLREAPGRETFFDGNAIPYTLRKGIGSKPEFVPKSTSIKAFIENKPIKEKAFNEAGTVQARRCLVDLLGKMLAYDPAERITPTEALQHPFISRAVSGGRLDDGGGAGTDNADETVGNTRERESGRQAPAPKWIKQRKNGDDALLKPSLIAGSERSGSNASSGTDHTGTGTPKDGVVRTSGSISVSDYETDQSVSAYEQDKDDGSGTATEWQTKFGISAPPWKFRPDMHPHRPPSVPAVSREVNYEQALRSTHNRAGATCAKDIYRARVSAVEAKKHTVGASGVNTKLVVKFNLNGSVVPRQRAGLDVANIEQVGRCRAAHPARTHTKVRRERFRGGYGGGGGEPLLRARTDLLR